MVNSSSRSSFSVILKPLSFSSWVELITIVASPFNKLPFSATPSAYISLTDPAFTLSGIVMSTPFCSSTSTSACLSSLCGKLNDGLNCQIRYDPATTSNKNAVPIVPKKFTSQALIMFPTSPPQGNEPKAFGKMNAKETEAISNPNVTYLRLRQIENTLRLNSKLIPTTKKKVQKRKAASPNPLYMRLCEVNAPNRPNRLLTLLS